MIKLYGFNLSFPTNKVRFALNLFNLEYEFVALNPWKGEHKSEAHIKRHPAGKVPVIEDGDFTLFESNAIVRYLAEKVHNTNYYPSDLQQQALVNQWLDFAAAHIGTNVSKVLFNRYFADKIGIEVDSRSMEEGHQFLTNHLPILEAQLTNNTYIAGNHMTIADIGLLASLDPVDLIDIDLNQYPHLNNWRKQLMKESFYTKVHQYYGEGFFEQATV
ncbi:glutathione S-transferase family protein [Thiotrichales bacterium 19X7-9]|nr:glutathione S-transferase family protein [Thiotrichales bacterium 19X7-9]